METKARVERIGRDIYVVVPQRVGAELRFLCETERDALHFLQVFQPKPPIRGPRAA